MARKASSPTILPRSEFLKRAQERSVRIHQQLREVVEGPPASPRLLHDLHRELRRARLDLRVLARGSDGTEQRHLRKADGALHELADSAGEARDHDVGAALLRSVVGRAKFRGAAKKGVVELERRIEGGATNSRRRLRRVSGRWLRRESPHLPARSTAASRESEERFRRAARKEIVRRHRDLERALARARKRPTVRRLHALRIGMRRYRNVTAALTRAGAGEFPVSWKKLQKDLGNHHDLSVLDAWLSSRSAGKVPAQLRREIRRAIRRRERAAQARFTRAMADLSAALAARPRP